MPDSGGRKARGDGKNREVIVRDLAILAGFPAVRSFKPAGCKTFLAIGLPYSVIGNNGRLEIDVYIRPCYRFVDGLGIEVTGQKVAGSGAHKMPHKVNTVKEAYRQLPCPGIIVVIDRVGFDTYFAVEWAQMQVDHEQLWGVYELDEYKEFLGLSVDSCLPSNYEQTEFPLATLDFEANNG